jgi:hypothetical protein
MGAATTASDNPMQCLTFRLIAAGIADRSGLPRDTRRNQHGSWHLNARGATADRCLADAVGPAIFNPAMKGSSDERIRDKTG